MLALAAAFTLSLRIFNHQFLQRHLWPPIDDEHEFAVDADRFFAFCPSRLSDLCRLRELTSIRLKRVLPVLCIILHILPIQLLPPGRSIVQAE